MSRNPLFDASYRRLFGHRVTISESANPFFATFYEYFLRDDAVRRLFSTTDMRHQQGMLRRSLFHLAAYYVSHEPSPEMERIAHIHATIGVVASHYDLWLDALVATVRAHDEQCDLATELAWRWAMSPGITYMRLFQHFATHGNPAH
jgi:hemoglobin-like flavoprotein